MVIMIMKLSKLTIGMQIKMLKKRMQDEDTIHLLNTN